MEHGDGRFHYANFMISMPRGRISQTMSSFWAWVVGVQHDRNGSQWCTAAATIWTVSGALQLIVIFQRYVYHVWGTVEFCTHTYAFTPDWVTILLEVSHNMVTSALHDHVLASRYGRYIAINSSDARLMKHMRQSKWARRRSLSNNTLEFVLIEFVFRLF